MLAKRIAKHLHCTPSIPVYIQQMQTEIRKRFSGSLGQPYRLQRHKLRDAMS